MPLNGYQSLCKDHQEKIVCRDKGESRIYRALNLDGCRVTQYQIDGCVIREASMRCDILLMNEDKRNAYLIELKGSDIEHAIEQLEATAQRLHNELKPYRVKYRLVHSRAKTHAINSTRFKKFCQRHSQRGEFIHKEGVLEEKI